MDEPDSRKNSMATPATPHNSFNIPSVEITEDHLNPTDDNDENDNSSTHTVIFSQTKQKNPDFVLVWNESKKHALTQDAFQRRSVFEYNLEQEGLILDWENGDTGSGLHATKIWAPLELLKRYSEILKVRLPMKQLSEEDAQCLVSNTESVNSLLSKRSKSTMCIMNCWTKCRNCLSLELDPLYFPERCRRLTEIYSRDKEYLFDVDEANMYDIFPISMRSRIVSYILRRKAYKSKEELENDNFAFGYERLVQQDVYEAGYPLHDGGIKTKGSTRKLLYDYWGKITNCFKYQPLDKIREYFGVNIALYFAWLGFYTRMLSFATCFGLIGFFYGVVSISKDQYVNDVCNSTMDITMCPLCDHACPYWKLSEKCSYSKLAHLFDNEFTILFALLMSIWTACFLEFWKRYSAKITHRWDLTSFDIRDFTPRPEYVAALKKIYATGAPGSGEDEEGANKIKYDFELNIPFWSRKLPFVLLSYSTVLFMVVLALSALIGVIMYRLWFTFWLSKGRASENDIAWERIIVSVTAAFLNLTFIVIFGKVYEKIAIRLTEMEFPRTQKTFDASYTLKIYLLQFVNNYSSIFYVAFFKGAYTGDPHKYKKLFGVLRQEECGISCMPELCIQLVVIMVGKQSKSMFVEAFIPWIRRILKRLTKGIKVAVLKHEKTTETESSHQIKNSQWTQDYDLLEWGQYLLTDEYLEMVLQFGFVTIFVTAFPLAPLFALINNLLELRIDAGKMLLHYRRPVGIRVKDIGVWSSIIDGIVKVAILSNACIIALTSNFIPKLMYRFVLQDPNSPTYGTLQGYLNDSLTVYDTSHLESKPDKTLVPLADASARLCHFPTYRHDHTNGNSYEYRIEHWQIWLARVVFIIIYENIVAGIIHLLCWMIPDVPNELLRKQQREQRMVNELILKQELLRSQKSLSARVSHTLHDIQAIQRESVSMNTTLPGQRIGSAHFR